MERKRPPPGTLSEAGGGEFGGPRGRAEELAYAELDAPFRTWVAGLTAQSTLRWKNTLSYCRKLQVSWA